VLQLLLYKQFKELARLLAGRQADHLRTHLRMAPPPKIEGRLDLSNVSVHDLYAAAVRVFNREDLRTPLREVVAPPKITIREKILLVANSLKASTLVRFRELIKTSPGRLHMVITFLAILELVRRYRISAQQEALFGDIELRRDDAWDEDLDFELEFTE